MIEVSYVSIFILEALLLLISALTIYSFFYLKDKKISVFIFLFCSLLLLNFMVKEKYNILPIKILSEKDELEKIHQEKNKQNLLLLDKTN